MKIFLLGATPSFDEAQAIKIEDRLARTGGNSGNQVIAYGLLQTLAYDHVAWDYSVGPRFVSENFDMIVIAAANFLFPKFDFGPMAQFIEQTNLPVAIVGLGAQSNDYSPKISLNPGTERFVRVVAERAVRIGVRGKFTAEVLAELGVHNVQVTGCPSYYMGGTVAPALNKKPFEKIDRLGINGSRDVVKHSFDSDKMRAALYGLVTQGMRHNAIFIAQTEIDEMTIAEQPGSSAATEAANRMADFFVPGGIDRSALKAWAAGHMRVYWSVERWLQEMKALDYVVGTRFHGAIAAISVGVPATILCHDTRTQEMAEFLCLPRADISTLNTIDLRELYEQIDVDAVAERRRQLIPLYRQFLIDNGLRYGQES